MELVTQGAEGKVYKSTWLGKSVIIKERFSKKYRHPDLDAQITKDRMKAEARALTRCQMMGIKVPALYDVDFDTGKIIMENLNNSITIRNYLYKINPEKDRELLQKLGEKIGSVIAKLHSNNIIHGDLTTSNMVLVEPIEENNVYTIDFGLSYIDEGCEDKAVDLYVLERAILSTHINSEAFVDFILNAYEKSGFQNSSDIIKRLNDVRLRGRKKVCFG